MGSGTSQVVTALPHVSWAVRAAASAVTVRDPLSPPGAGQCRHGHMVRLLGRSRSQSTRRPRVRPAQGRDDRARRVRTGSDGGGSSREPGHRWGPLAGLRSALSGRSVAGQVFVLQVVIVVLLVAAGAWWPWCSRSGTTATREARNRSLAVAETFANAPGIRRGAAAAPIRRAVLQPRAEAARKAAGVDFIVVMNTDGHPLHPSPAGPDRQAVRRHDRTRRSPGESFTESVDGHPRPAGPGRGARQGRPTARSSAWCRPGITVENVSGVVDRPAAAAPRPPPPRPSPWPPAAPRWSAGGCGARPTASARPR